MAFKGKNKDKQRKAFFSKRTTNAQYRKSLKKLAPFADADKDRVPNIKDCRPFDKKRQDDFQVSFKNPFQSSTGIRFERKSGVVRDAKDIDEAKQDVLKKYPFARELGVRNIELTKPLKLSSLPFTPSPEVSSFDIDRAERKKSLAAHTTTKAHLQQKEKYLKGIAEKFYTAKPAPTQFSVERKGKWVKEAAPEKLFAPRRIFVEKIPALKQPILEGFPSAFVTPLPKVPKVDFGKIPQLDVEKVEEGYYTAAVGKPHTTEERNKRRKQLGLEPL